MSEEIGAVEKPKATNSLFAVFIALGVKAGQLFKYLKLIKFAKYFITMISMSISAIAYGFAYGSWTFAIGLVLLLFVHEMGHVLAMKRKGMQTSAPVFIPFLGAAIFVPNFDSRDEEAYVGIGGPFIGSLGALACILLARALPQGSHAQIVLDLLGNVGLLINLFNMIPARPLDGGRILYAVGRWGAYAGIPILLILAYVAKDPFFVLIALLSSGSLPIRKWVLGILYAPTLFVMGLDLIMDAEYMSFFGAMFEGVLVFFIALSLAYAWRERHTPLAKPEPEQDVPMLGVRIKWLLLYILLVVAIGGAMVWQGDHLPPEAKKGSLTHLFS